MRVLVFPRDDPNPYQRLLYGEMERLGTRVSYLGRLTPSRTLNLLLLPLEVAVRRAGGARLVHLHWVFGFGLPGGSRFAGMRRLAQAWFTLWLRTTRLLGVRIVWTAHNVLPHSPVFADDIAARRALVAASDLVLAHSAVGPGGSRRARRGAAEERHHPARPAYSRGPRCFAARRPAPAAGRGGSCSSGRSWRTRGPRTCSPPLRRCRRTCLRSSPSPANAMTRICGLGSRLSPGPAASVLRCASNAFPTGTLPPCSGRLMLSRSLTGASPPAAAPCSPWLTDGLC